MLATLKRHALAAAGALGLLAIMLKLRRGRTAPDARKILDYLATRTSSPVPDLSRRLKMSALDTVRLLADVEQRGWIQLSSDQGAAHTRIAAITNAGREQIAGASTP